MDKEKIFNTMLESAINTSTVIKIKTGDLVYYDYSIYVKNDNTMTFLCMIPYEDEDKKEIHGNIRNSIGNQFVNNYKYEDILNLFNLKEKKKLNHIKLEENNKYKLLDLAPNLQKFKNITNDIEFRVNHMTNKYYLSIDNIGMSIEIYNDNDYINYILVVNYKKTIVTKEELIDKMNSIYDKCKSEYDKKEEEKKRKLEKLDKEIKLENFISKLYNEDKYIIIKYNSSYTCFYNGQKYSVGKGKRGKFYNTSYYQFEKFITSKKDINKVKYCVLDNFTNIDNINSWDSIEI